MPNSKPNAAGDCPNFAPAEHVGTVTGKSLSEISGIVSSRRQQDVFWVHNDSGNTPRVYALDRAGKQLAAITLPVEADDWEDIARGRHQGEGNYLYLADTGDNLGVRESIVIHRFREPTLRGPSTPRSLKKTAVETMRARYPDGPHDAEALFVDPVDDSLYLITKPKFSSPQLYRALRFEEAATFTFETTLSLKATGLALKWVTGAHISADGTWIAVRTYAQIALFKRRPHMTVSEALSAPGCVVNPPAEQQGEAISFVEFTTHQSSSPPALVTVSEGNPTSLFWLTPEKPE